MMNGPSVRHNRLSLSAVVMLFFLGVFTLVFVDTLAGALIVLLSGILYTILGRLAPRFGRTTE